MALSPLAQAGDRAPVPFFPYMTPAAMAVAALSPGGCRWPSGLPAEAAFGFCSAPRAGRSSYCAVHRRLAVVAGVEARS